MLRMLWALVLLFGWFLPVRADVPFRYPEAKHGRGELKYVDSIPVLVLTGSPEEMGEQMGVLALKPAAKAIQLFQDFLDHHGLGKLRPLLARVGEGLLNKFPDDYRRELEAATKASGVERDLLIIGNTFHDIKRLTGCSALIVDPKRSGTGGPLVGRNLDYTFLKGMHQYSLVIVYRPTGKIPFAVVSFPGATVLGCAMSAINAKGLVFGQNDVRQSSDGSPAFDPTKTPTAVLARRILEECDCMAKAEKILLDHHPAGRSILLACDLKGGGVFEATPKTVVFRREEAGVCEATNHFHAKELFVPRDCARGAALVEACRLARFDVSDVVRTMQSVHQEGRTAHAVVFEPARLTIHVAFGDGIKPATAFPLTKLDLAKWLTPSK